MIDEHYLCEYDNCHCCGTEYADAEFFLTNYDLLLSPHGTGKDYRECFESFIADCDDYIRKVTAVRDEARMHMEKLLKAAESLENQNRESSHED